MRLVKAVKPPVTRQDFGAVIPPRRKQPASTAAGGCVVDDVVDSLKSAGPLSRATRSRRADGEFDLSRMLRS